MLATHLKEILADRAQVSLKADYSMILKEQKVMTVKVTQMPLDVTAVNMNKVGHLPGVKDGELRQICDYLLVSNSEGMEHAIFIELKKTLKEGKKGMEQLRRSLPILEYLRSVCQIHHMTNGPALEVRYFLIGTKNHTRIDKQGVRPRLGVEKEIYNGIVVHTYLGERIRFNLLLNGATDG